MVLVLCALPVQARQEAQCSTVKVMVAYVNSFGESLAFERIIAGTNMWFQFWITDDGHSWSVLLVSDSIACLVADGGEPVRRIEL